MIGTREIGKPPQGRMTTGRLAAVLWWSVLSRVGGLGGTAPGMRKGKHENAADSSCAKDLGRTYSLDWDNLWHWGRKL